MDINFLAFRGDKTEIICYLEKLVEDLKPYAECSCEKIFLKLIERKQPDTNIVYYIDTLEQTITILTEIQNCIHRLNNVNFNQIENVYVNIYMNDNLFNKFRHHEKNIYKIIR